MSFWNKCKSGLMKAEGAVSQALDVVDAAEKKMVKSVCGTDAWSKCKGAVTKVTTSKHVAKAKVAVVKAIDLSKPIPMAKPLPVVRQVGPVTIYTYINVGGK